MGRGVSWRTHFEVLVLLSSGLKSETFLVCFVLNTNQIFLFCACKDHGTMRSRTICCCCCYYGCGCCYGCGRCCGCCYFLRFSSALSFVLSQMGEYRYSITVLIVASHRTLSFERNWFSRGSQQPTKRLREQQQNVEII